MSPVKQDRRGQNRRGVPATEGQKAAMANGTKTAAVKRTQRKKIREQAAELEKPRWKQLEDGDITPRDLTMDELIRGECANNDGTWEGRRHKLNPRTLGRVETERRRRIRRDFDKLAPAALEAFEDMIDDVENPAQRLAAARMVLEHQIGKVPDVVHVNHETEWDRLQQTGFRILRGEESVAVEGEDGDDIVDAEVVED